MKRSRVACASVVVCAAIGGVLMVGVSLGHAQSDGVSLCDGSGTAVSKPVGNEQWSVQYDPRLNAVNGTVFDPVDQSVQFVSCLRQTATPQTFTFQCASPASDDPNRWDVFATDVPIAPSFFRLPEFYENPDLSALGGGRMRLGTDKGGREGSSYMIDAILDASLEGIVLRGQNAATGNPVAIITTYGNGETGTSQANYVLTEFGDGVCELTLFNVQLFPPSSGEISTTGLVTGSGLTTARNADGTCSSEAPTGSYGAAGVIGSISVRFRPPPSSTSRAFVTRSSSLLR